MAKISIAKMKKKFFGNFIFFMQKEGRLGQNWSYSPRTTLQNYNLGMFILGLVRSKEKTKQKKGKD